MDNITAFLANTPYADWAREPLPGDASSRQYLRLTHKDQSAIVMIAPADASFKAFATIGTWLKTNGLNAPRILKQDTTQGLMLLQDLGPKHLAQWIAEEPQDATLLYETATDVLITLDSLSPPPNLVAITPDVAGTMLDVTCDWYAINAEKQSLNTEMARAFNANCPPPTTLALRDYHAENLIWQPYDTGTNRIGLLDFQDAVIAPRGYDLASLLRDVRRKVDPDLAETMTTRFAKGTNTPLETLTSSVTTLAVQRNLRILGVLARLAQQDGKRHYIKHMPHLWDMITKDLQHPSLSALQHTVKTILPPPEHSAIKDLL